MIDYGNEPQLYYFDDIHKIQKSLEYAKNLPPGNKDDGQVTFHFYWRVPREFARKQLLPLKATLVTQRKRETKVILWSNVDLKNNQYFETISPYVETRIWSLRDEIEDTPLSGGEILKGQVDDELCWLGGDLFRLLTLYKYGGMYLDMDTVPLRDFSPLLDHEFMYQWGSSGTTKGEPQLMINGAVMHLFKESGLAEDLLRELAKTPGIPNSNSWGRDLYAKVRARRNDLAVLPCSWFDIDWALEKKLHPRGPFKNNIFLNKKKLYLDGPFAWHWHNQWDAKIGRTSKFAIIEKMVEEEFGKLER